jgi:hypothetical protein
MELSRKSGINLKPAGCFLSFLYREMADRFQSLHMMWLQPIHSPCPTHPILNSLPTVPHTEARSESLAGPYPCFPSYFIMLTQLLSYFLHSRHRHGDTSSKTPFHTEGLATPVTCLAKTIVEHTAKKRLLRSLVLAWRSTHGIVFS